MWQQPPGYRLTPKALAALGELELRTKPLFVADRLWNKVFLESEREQLGGNLHECYSRLGTVGMLGEVKAFSHLRALLEVGRAVGALGDVDFRWLMREIGESEDAAECRGSLCWDRQRRELRLGAKVIRRVRGLAVAANIASILDAFEKAGWQPRIPTPTAIDISFSSQPVHDAVHNLNKGLDGIAFHVDEGGTALFWTRS